MSVFFSKNSNTDGQLDRSTQQESRAASSSFCYNYSSDHHGRRRRRSHSFLRHNGQDPCLINQPSMHGTWNTCQQSGKLLTFSPVWKSWRQTEHPERSPMAFLLYSSVILTSGSLSMDARGMPLVPSISNRSGDSLKGDESTEFIWLRTTRCTAGSTFSRTSLPVRRL